MKKVLAAMLFAPAVALASDDTTRDLAGADLCIAAAPHEFKDPETVRIRDVKPFQSAFRQLTLPTYSMRINAKNSYGAYVGEELYFCQLTQDESQFVRLTLIPE